MAVVSGGTTLIDNGALDAAVPTGSLILLSTQTASSSASIEFTSGIDSTYDSYVFKFINIHPATDNVNYEFNFSTNGGSNYNVTKTTTAFRAQANQASPFNVAITYRSTDDLAQSTANQMFCERVDASNSKYSVSGYMYLFAPSSNTFVKHFMTYVDYHHDVNYLMSYQVAGYCNTTSAVDAVKFVMSSGNIDDGIIKMYGVK